MLGLKKNEVRLVKYTEDWTTSFEQEKQTLEKIIGKGLVDIQHIGSTAIPGIQTKPLVDILIGVKEIEDVQMFDTVELREAGYYHLRRVRIEGKEVFAKFSSLEPPVKTHVVHVVEIGKSWWRDHLYFRDYLLEHRGVAEQYEDLKQSLAAKYPTNEKAYADAKRAFVEKVLATRSQ